MPGAQCTRSPVCAGVVKYAHGYSQRRHRKHPAFPTQWFYGLYVISPVTSSFLPPSPRGLNGASDTRLGRHASTRLDISNGCQDHTTSPYASAPFVLRVCRSPTREPALRSCFARDAAASTASHPNVRDDREPPLLRDEMAVVVNLIWVFREAIYFSRGDWTGIREPCPSRLGKNCQAMSRV